MCSRTAYFYPQVVTLLSFTSDCRASYNCKIQCKFQSRGKAENDRIVSKFPLQQRFDVNLERSGEMPIKMSREVKSFIMFSENSHGAFFCTFLVAREEALLGEETTCASV